MCFELTFSFLHHQMRVVLYMAQALSEDTETQKKGFVFLVVAHSEAMSYMSKPSTQHGLAEMLRAYPVRLSTFHFCLPEGPLSTIFRSIFLFGLGDSDMRVRTKFHSDIGVGTLYKLMSVGIPVSEIPLTNNQTIKVKNLCQWIKTRRTFEQAYMNGVDTSSWIEHPQNHDVLFRKGGHTVKQGNVDFLHSLERYLEFYFTGNAKDKRCIRDAVIRDSLAKGCRFLEFDSASGLWMEIHCNESLHKKVSNLFYDHKRRLESRQQTSDCDTTFFLEGNKRRKIEGEFNMCSFKW